jgi:hypothetical protein
MFDGGIVDQREFVQALVTLCKDKSSGTVFYNLNSGASARLVLNHGEICWVAFGELRGEEAIDEIRLIDDNGRMNFNPSLKLAIGKQSLPTTPEILRAINARSRGHETHNHDLDLGITTSTLETSETIIGKSYDKWEVYTIVEEQSLEYIGPIAKVLCAEYTKSMPAQIGLNDVRKIINAIARDIDDKFKAQQFKDNIKGLLKIDNL